MMDVDTGIDDALALLYLLASPEAEITGIAATAGNVATAQVAANNLALLELCRAPPIELAASHKVARNTAREAIRQLAESGLVTAKHGRGVLVRSKPRLMRIGQSRYYKKLRDHTR
ncbi:nucleoside hydrolase, partial [Nocardia wallacei]|uniref:nucleoside hydrolase n=1 Tax=Nocardia wallacei TaxID=480035 RepID=UPI002457FCBE